MRTLLIVALALAACKKGDDKPRKLKKMDYKVSVDEKGRMLPEIELFDDKHTSIVVTGSYTLTLTRPDGTVLCSTTRTLAKEDYNDKKKLKSDWQDAACPPDPAAEELRITLEVKTGDKPEDIKLSRDKTTPTKFIYRHLAVKKPDAVDPKKLPAEAPLPEPAPGSGSAGAGSADVKAIDTKPTTAEADNAKGSAATTSGSADVKPKPTNAEADKATGSAAK